MHKRLPFRFLAGLYYRHVHRLYYYEWEVTKLKANLLPKYSFVFLIMNKSVNQDQFWIFKGKTKSNKTISYPLRMLPKIN